mmetsp:Transcript_8172/g.12488  ORF Transcript_8172/g.12488 Transcript_8172/m.12488 type:complete len:229 (-) Transcript_8172:8-694(-)
MSSALNSEVVKRSSSTPPFRVETTGTPQAMASRADRQRLSAILDTIKISAVATARTASRRDNAPHVVTRSKLFTAASVAASRNSPSPTNTRPTVKLYLESAFLARTAARTATTGLLIARKFPDTAKATSTFPKISARRCPSNTDGLAYSGRGFSTIIALSRNRKARCRKEVETHTIRSVRARSSASGHTKGSCGTSVPCKTHIIRGNVAGVSRSSSSRAARSGGRSFP